MRLWAGIDIGSVSLKLVVIGDNGEIIADSYRRTEGKPLVVLRQMLAGERARFGEFAGLAATGSGRNLLSRVLGCPSKNEILTHARGAVELAPDVRTIIEIGGQDSKLIFCLMNAERKALKSANIL